MITCVLDKEDDNLNEENDERLKENTTYKTLHSSFLVELDS